jgi:pimeloyl-ACP methyl ester carboxylesterase
MKLPPRLLAAGIVSFLMAGTLALAWLVLIYQGDLHRARERVSTGSHLIDTPCGPIEFAAAGAGPAVLLVHGAGGGFDQALGFAEQLAGHGFRAIAMSRFGYLRTPLPADASPAAQADAHACLLDALGIDRAAIVGVSAGAPSSMQFALRYPERAAALVLLVPLAYAPRDDNPPSRDPSPAAQFMFEKAIKSDLLFWIALKTAPSLVVKTILATPPEVVAKADAEEQTRVRELMEHILPLSERQAGLLNDAAIAKTLLRYELEWISAPTLVVSLADDLYGTFKSACYTAAHIPGARFIGYPSGGHAWLGHHGEILAQLVTFLGSPRTPLAAINR